MTDINDLAEEYVPKKMYPLIEENNKLKRENADLKRKVIFLESRVKSEERNAKIKTIQKKQKPLLFDPEYTERRRRKMIVQGRCPECGSLEK